MALTPDQLLIFNQRDTGEVKLQKKGKQKALTKFQPSKESEPAVIKENPEPQKINEQILIKKEASQAEPAKSKEFDIFSKVIKQPVQESSIYNLTPENLSKTTDKKEKGKSTVNSIKSRTCAWHPWREAYAFCNYCRRPFCYQDTVEFNRNYYCLEDIERVSTNYREKRASSSINTSLVSGLLLILAFLTFFYYANSQIFYVFNYLNKVGFPFFITHIKYSYATALLETVLMGLALVSAILIFLQSKKGFYIGFLVCLSCIAIFSYFYATTETFYTGLISIIMFFAFIGLLYSRATVPSENNNYISTSAELERNMSNWKNVGRF